MKIRWILSSLLLITVLLGCATSTSSRSSPDKLIEQFCRASAANDSETQWALLSDQVKSQNGLRLDDFRESVRRVPVSVAKVLSKTAVDKNHVRYWIRITFDRGDETIGLADVVRHDTGWQIDRWVPGYEK